jgi:hypothetical protein
MSPVREQEYDAPWKTALEMAFDLFLGLGLPDLHAFVDWPRDYESLDQELQKLMRESTTGVRRVDKLFKVFHKDTGDPRFFHVEVQAQPQPEQEFGVRMYTYNYRGRDHFGQPIISIAVLTDDQANWHPRKYHEGEHGSEVTFTFRTVKVLKWARRQRGLEASENLFGLFVSAHLEALKTCDDPKKRAAGKTRLLSNLFNRGLTDLERDRWYRVIDWILPLPPEWEKQVFQKLHGEKAVTFITYAERVGMEKGMEKGLEKGREEGSRDTSLRSLRAALKAKFGEEGESLLAQLPEQTPLARLEELVLLVAVNSTLDAVRPHFMQTEKP